MRVRSTMRTYPPCRSQDAVPVWPGCGLEMLSKVTSLAETATSRRASYLRSSSPGPEAQQAPQRSARPEFHVGFRSLGRTRLKTTFGTPGPEIGRAHV